MTATPAPFKLAWAGALGVPLLVIGAVTVRGPVFPDDGDAAAAASATASSDDDRPRGPSGSPGSAAHPGRSAVPLLSALRPVVDQLPNVSPAAPSNSRVGSAAEIHAAVDDLERNFRGNNITSAIASLKTLIDIDPDVVKDAHDTIIDLAQRVMLLKGSEPQDMFDLLVNKMGTAGIDVLYEMVTTKGGSDAAVESKKLLEKPEVLGRGTPAVQCAFKLREASLNSGCDAIKALFPDIRQNGDGRSLGQLYLLGHRCGRHHVGSCCLSGDSDLDETVKALQAKGYQ